MNNDAPPAFAETQRQDLQRLGFNPEQIARIERDALPAAANYLRPLDRTDDVRRWLHKFRHAAKGPGPELESLLAQAVRPGAPLALVGAVRRLASAAYTLDRAAGAPFLPGFTGDDGADRVARLRADPERLASVVDAAIETAPLQRRRNAGAGAVWAIHFVVSPMGWKLSSSPKSVFRELVGMCFEAILGEDMADPERAIRAVIREARREISGR